MPHACQTTCKNSALDPQAAYRELARSDRSRSVSVVKEDEGTVLLLDLPDGTLEDIASWLLPDGLASLQTACSHLNQLLKHDRFWQDAFEKHDPVWMASGVCPLPGRPNARTWKELVAISCRLHVLGIGGDVLVSPQAVCHRGLNLWNSGKARNEMRVQLDYHLVHTEHKSSMWRQLLGQHHFRAENIADLMELIYFLWFEARQLTRAAKMLAKVLKLLAEDRAHAAPEVAEERMGYSTMQLAISAASAGAYLTDLLHMRSYETGPMCVTNPDDFLKACQGAPFSDSAFDHGFPDTIEWAGGVYSWDDIGAAISILCLPDEAGNGDTKLHQTGSIANQASSIWHTSQDQSSSNPPGLANEAPGLVVPATPTHSLAHLNGSEQSQREGEGGDESDQESSVAEQYAGPWLRTSWAVFHAPAQALLNGLAEAEVIPWDVLQAWGAVLKRKVAAISTSRREGCLAPSDACRGYALYAASSLLNRLHSGPDSTIVYAQTGRLYDSAKQYRRAAHYYKMHIMHNFGSGYLPGDNGEYSALLCLAGAYDWDSVATGSLHSYQQAFAWQRALVRCLVTNSDKPALLFKQARILGDMLTSPNPRHAPHLHLNSRLVLAVGAYQTSMKHSQSGAAVVAWLQGYHEMLAVAEQAFLAFLEDAQEAFDIMTQHAARRRAMRNQALKVSNSSGHPSSCIGSHDGEEAAGSRGSSGGDADTNRGTSARSPPLVFTPAHVDFITQLADVMARLPRGSAGQPLYAIAASISSRLSATQ